MTNYVTLILSSMDSTIKIKCVIINTCDIFSFYSIDALEESDEKLVEFAIGGLCNAALGNQY